MLVVHQCSDPSISFLRAFYEGLEGIRCFHGDESKNMVRDALFHLPLGETVMLLGHGTADAGLFRRLQDGNGEYRYDSYIDRSMVYCLRKHPVIGIWCYADQFADQFHLHGLFSGLIISEEQEGEDNGIQTTAAELEQENRLFASTLSGLLRDGIPFAEIPVRMKEAIGDRPPAVRVFNYNSLYAK